MDPASDNRFLFIDMNSYFASVEQQENPELRGRPVIVAPVVTDTSCAIAASYEAKAFGIRTGTGIGEAKRMCPNLEIVPAHPYKYRDYHQRIVDVLNRHFVDVKPLSVDEMACRVSRFYSGSEAERKVAIRVKQDIYRDLGEIMRCSIGIANNVFLAKVCTEMEKPDGLTVLDESNFPDALYKLELSDFPGIGKQMLVRLKRQGIHTVKQMYSLSPWDLHRVWGGIGGERWWHILRGSQNVDYESNVREQAKSVGHSHVLPPKFRSLEGSRGILMRLVSRATKRLRGYGLAARSVHLHVRFMRDRFGGFGPDDPRPKRSWDCHCELTGHANDDITWMSRIRPALAGYLIPDGWTPLRVGATFTNIVALEDANLTLFEDFNKRARLFKTVDDLNERFGHVVDLASTFWLREQAPYRIAFGASMLDHVTG